MKPESHLRLLVLVTLAWGFFWIGGLPNYYQQYSTAFMVVFDLLILPPICLLVFRSVRNSNPENTFRNFLWWAFYISVPLFFYDLIYCGLYLGDGLNFLAKYWYISVYYILPWIVFPPMGWLMQKRYISQKLKT